MQEPSRPRPELSAGAFVFGATLVDPIGMGASLARPTGAASEQETLALLRSSIAKLATRIDSRAIDRDSRIPEAVIDEARGAGLFALTIPEVHGGLGLSLHATCAVIDELARIDRSVAVMIGLHAGLGTAGLCSYGSEEQQARLLPRLAQGEPIASFAATEADAGSDLMAIGTTGVKAPGGLRVRGSKCYVTNGAFAGLYTLLVRTPDHGGARAQSLLCIPRGTPGFSVGAEEDKMGIRGSSAVTLELDDVLVPERDVIGTPGKGSDYANHVLSWGRTLMSAGCLGTARAALSLTLAHVTTRRQFGRTLSSFPLVQSDCAAMAARIYAMEALIRLAAQAEHDVPRLEMLSALAKVYSSETAFWVCDRAIQLHGALGYLETTGVPRLLRDNRITRIFEGANDVLLLRTGALVLAAPAGDKTASLPPRLSFRLGERARACDTLLEERASTIELLRARHGLSIMKKQALLWALGQAEMYVGAAVAALLRGSAETSASERALSDHAVSMLIAEASAQLSAARDPNTEAKSERSREVAELLFSPFGARTAPERFEPRPEKSRV